MTSNSTIDDLIALSQNRWMVPLLADLAAHKGARFVELLNRLGLSRDSLSRTLEAAKLSGYIMPNPGHGHPLRPEYILTEQGHRLSIIAAAIFSAQHGISLPPASLTRWSLPLVRVMHMGGHRFNVIARALPHATPRALSQCLRGLAEEKLVKRELVEGYPPTSRYRLTENGNTLARAA